MLNKKLTKKNTGKKQWKSKKRKRVLRGGEGDDPIDGTMMCPPKLIHRNPKLIEYINTINTITTKLENDKLIDKHIKTEIDFINGDFISKEYGVEDDIIEKYNNLMYVDSLNTSISLIGNKISEIIQGQHIKGDIPNDFFNNNIPKYIINIIKEKNDVLEILKHNNELLKKIKQYNEDNNDMIFFKSLINKDKIHKLINHYNPNKLVNLDKSLDNKIDDFKNIKMRYGITRIINDLFNLTYYSYNKKLDKYYIQEINLLGFNDFKQLKANIDNNKNNDDEKVDIIKKFNFNKTDVKNKIKKK